MGSSFLDKLYKKFRKLCGNDDTCILIVLLVLGFALCVLTNEGFDSQNTDTADSSLRKVVEEGEKLFGFGKKAPRTKKELATGTAVDSIGLTPKSNRAKVPPPSLADDMQILGKQTIPNFGGSSQAGTVVAQDGTIARPFSEVWTPGYAPVDVAFESAVPLDATTPPTDSPIDASMKSTSQVEGTGAGIGKGIGEGLDITMYHAPWCGHCKQMLPEFDKFLQEHDGKSVGSGMLTVKAVNSDDYPADTKAAGVTMFPTVKVNGEVHKGFPRTYQGMKNYLKELVGSSKDSQASLGPQGSLSSVETMAPV